jgi:adenylyltransferase/sulfurtransferase
MQELSTEEIDYYSRQIILPGWNRSIQQKLKNAKVLVVGAGALGCSVLQSLSRAGIGNIGIVDDDNVSISNLQRQILFDNRDIGKHKVLAAEEKINSINPNIKTEIYKCRINEENSEKILLKFDMVVDGSDNFKTKFLLDEVCNKLSKPLIYAAIEAFEGQVSVFHYGENSPTYRCLFPTPPASSDQNNCASIGVSPSLPQIIGGLQANEVIKIITGIGEVLSGKLLIYNSNDCLFSKFSIRKSFLENPTTTKETKKNSTSILEKISYSEIKKDEENYFLIDVRSEEEHLAFNIGGQNIPIYELDEFLETRINRINKNIVTYCKSGQTAKQAALIISGIINKKVYYLDTPLNALMNSDK